LEFENEMNEIAPTAKLPERTAKLRAIDFGGSDGGRMGGIEPMRVV